MCDMVLPYCVYNTTTTSTTTPAKATYLHARRIGAGKREKMILKSGTEKKDELSTV